MYKNLRNTEEIMAKLPDVPRNPKEDLEKIQRMNSEAEEVHNDFLYKEAMSEQSAAQVILF